MSLILLLDKGQAPPPGPSAMYPPLPPDQVHKGGHIPPPQHQQALPVVTQVTFLFVVLVMMT